MIPPCTEDGRVAEILAGAKTAAPPAATTVEQLREEYADNELDHDRLPTEAGFVRWLAWKASR